jgi:uncharacterized membrane protein YhaH (DUF805 family)
VVVLDVILTLLIVAFVSGMVCFMRLRDLGGEGFLILLKFCLISCGLVSKRNEVNNVKEGNVC